MSLTDTIDAWKSCRPSARGAVLCVLSLKTTALFEHAAEIDERVTCDDEKSRMSRVNDLANAFVFARHLLSAYADQSYMDYVHNHKTKLDATTILNTYLWSAPEFRGEVLQTIRAFAAQMEKTYGHLAQATTKSEYALYANSRVGLAAALTAIALLVEATGDYREPEEI